jgi:hypothetical protein
MFLISMWELGLFGVSCAGVGAGVAYAWVTRNDGYDDEGLADDEQLDDEQLDDEQLDDEPELVPAADEPDWLPPERTWEEITGTRDRWTAPPPVERQPWVFVYPWAEPAPEEDTLTRAADWDGLTRMLAEETR